MKSAIFVILLIVFSGIGVNHAFAHTTVQAGSYEIEVGWEDEPPVVGYQNSIVIEISMPGENEGVKTGIKNAFRNLDAVVSFGGVKKTLDVNSDPKPGHYFAKIIPTRTGSMVVDISGKIKDTVIDASIPVEDIEGTAVLDFPPTSGSSSGQEVAALKNAISSLQKEVTTMKSKVGGIDANSGDFSAETAYNFGMFGLALGGAGVILAIIAMVRRR